LFRPGDVDDLARTLELAWQRPEYMNRLGEQARAEYEAKYTAAANYRQLMAIYEEVIAQGSHSAEIQPSETPALPLVEG